MSSHPEADSDVAGIVDRAYELISFAAGGEPQWGAFRALFADQCALALRVFPEDPTVTVMDLDEYVVAQMREGLSDEGYAEIPGERVVEIIGDVATVHQRFGMQFATGPAVPAVDVFCLARVHGHWRIVSIVSDMDRESSSRSARSA
ncbi:MAG: hypothetical protein HZB15_00130 [Actinobacteria bacterium]|nr:hypothetical protein [Actinomycetota bacterium]